MHGFRARLSILWWRSVPFIFSSSWFCFTALFVFTINITHRSLIICSNLNIRPKFNPSTISYFTLILYFPIKLSYSILIASYFFTFLLNYPIQPWILIHPISYFPIKLSYLSWSILFLTYIFNYPILSLSILFFTFLFIYPILSWSILFFTFLLNYLFYPDPSHSLLSY